MVDAKWKASYDSTSDISISFTHAPIRRVDVDNNGSTEATLTVYSRSGEVQTRSILPDKPFGYYVDANRVEVTTNGNRVIVDVGV